MDDGAGGRELEAEAEAQISAPDVSGCSNPSSSMGTTGAEGDKSWSEPPGADAVAEADGDAEADPDAGAGAGAGAEA